MIITLPNYIFENKHLYQIINDDSVIASKSSIYKKDMMSLRNSMHLVMLLVNGRKSLCLGNGEISIDANDILFLSQGNYFMGEILGDKNDFEVILIYFDDKYVFDFINKYNISLPQTVQIDTLHITRDKYMQDCIQMLDKYFESDINNSLALVKLKLEELFLYFIIKR